jgi:hypothetical protein
MLEEMKCSMPELLGGGRRRRIWAVTFAHLVSISFFFFLNSFPQLLLISERERERVPSSPISCTMHYILSITYCITKFCFTTTTSLFL